MVPIPRRASSFLVVVFIHVNRKEEEEGRENSLPKVATFFTDYKYTTSPSPLSYTIHINTIFIYIHAYTYNYDYSNNNAFIDRINVRYKLLGTYI